MKDEDQCVALFRLLEQDCMDDHHDGVNTRPFNSAQKGIWELRGLVSTVNYDGLSSRSRNKVFSTCLGAISGCK